jgi:hypothetical protein
MVYDTYLMRIRKLEELKQKSYLDDYLATVAGDDGFRPMPEGGCPIWRNKPSGAEKRRDGMNPSRPNF